MRLIALVFVLMIGVGVPAFAQDPNFSNLPPLPAGAMDEGAPIQITPEGPAVIKLDEDAASVIVGNPSHATALLENPRLIMVMPAQPGATKIIALDRNGKAILNRHVLVAGGQAGYIRVNRACGSSDNASCQPVSMFYCPDRCYETAVTAPGAQTMATGDAGVAAPAAPSASGDVEVPDSVGENPISVEGAYSE